MNTWSNKYSHLINKIYIDKTSKHNLINTLKNRRGLVKIIMYKKYFKIHPIINLLNLPLELCGIINEYTNEYIELICNILDYEININTIIFQEITLSDTIFKTYDDKKCFLSTSDKSHNQLFEYKYNEKFGDGIILCNKFMELYNKKLYIACDGYDSNQCYCIYENGYYNTYARHSSGYYCYTSRKIKNKKVLKNIIVILKILINIVQKYIVHT
jgi:hypothetical protein